MRTDEVLTSADGHAQTSESPNIATAIPSARRGPDAAEQHAGLLELNTQPSAASIRPP